MIAAETLASLLACLGPGVATMAGAQESEPANAPANSTDIFETPAS